jgi:hypothetical protein
MMDAGSYAVYSLNLYSIPLMELISEKGVDYTTWPAETSKIAYCPGDKPWTQERYRPEPGWWGTWGQRQDSYSINYWLSHGKPDLYRYHNHPDYTPPPLGPPEAGPGMVYVRSDAVGFASDKVLFAETHYSGVAGAVWLFTQTTPYGTWGCRPMVYTTTYPWIDTGAISYARHPYGFTSSFVDGHAQFIHADDQPGPWFNPATAADVAEMNRHWIP